MDSMVNAVVYGDKWKGSLAKYDPKSCELKNSPMLVNRGLERVLADLAKLGFDAEWGCVPASYAGAPHNRNRIWIVAHANGIGLERRHFLYSQGHGKAKARSVQGLDQKHSWPDVSNPRAFGSGDGVAHRTHRLKAIGNGQVPQCAATAWRILGGC